MTSSPTRPFDLARKEVQHVDHPRAVWTAFDRYSRYATLSAVVRQTLGPGTHRVLDVGDSSGYLLAFDDDLDVLSLDVVAGGDALPGARLVLGDGAALPLGDGAVEAVISSDTLEHIEPSRRRAFLHEAARVARTLVVLAAPFDTPGVGGAEELVRRFALLTTGQPQVQLEEHRDYGLPQLEETRSDLAEAGLVVEVRGNGNLHDWVAMMLVKHQLAARPALDPLNQGYDIAYNYLFASRNGTAPFYRHVFAGARGTAIRWPSPAASSADPGALLAGWLAANSAEAVRMDVVPALAELTTQTTASAQALERLTATVDRLQLAHDVLQDEHRALVIAHAEHRLRAGVSLDRIEAALGALHGRLDTLAMHLRHPVRAARRALKVRSH